ncbi:YabP/YqfC family sporulation protein, partial [Dysosmobacter welbionis]
LLAVRQMHQSHHSEHHPLVTGGQIVQHLPRFLPLLLQIVGHHRGEVAVAVLPSLPVGDIRLHAQQAGLHLPHRLVGGDRDHIEGQHHGAVQGRQLVD